jgi:PAP2 superfamily
MKTKIYFMLLVFASVLSITGCSDQSTITGTGFSSTSPPASSFDARYAIDWMDVAYRIIADQNPAPPPPSRFYSYCCVALYECVLPGMPNHVSLSGQLNEMPPMPIPEIGKAYDWPSVITGAMPVVMRGSIDTLYLPSVSLINSTYTAKYQERVNAVGQEIVERSVAYGELIGRKISEWASTDRFRETRTMRYVTPPRSQNPANWVPCNPGDSACEPYWGTLRTFVLRSPEDIPMPINVPFSTESNSLFYKEADEIRKAGEHLTVEQKQIANFWNDKIRTGTPSGHWISIINQVAPQLGLRLDRVIEVYTFTGIAIHDAFIYCWYNKYKYNLLRPETYIQDYIDPNWYPFILSPAFPEYPSGHSVLSGAVSEVLTSVLGTVSFTDRTHNYIGFPERHFNSFNDAANEAGFSRLYGGIHFRAAIERGLDIGRMLGRYIMARVHLQYAP